MVPGDNLIAFVGACVLFVVIPGPSVLFVVGRSVALGRRGGLLSVAGNSLGTLPAIAAVAFGVGAVVAASVLAFTLIKIAGAAYLVWLGIQAIRHRHDAAKQQSPAWKIPAARLLRQGFVVGLTNPKTLAFFVAVLPQFVDPTAGPVWAQLLMLGLILQGIGLVCDVTWAVLAGAARTWFARSPRRLSTLSGAGGVMMIGLGGTLAISGAKS
jgi:threonine/homoserine/homoserine lactone efflux protein